MSFPLEENPHEVHLMEAEWVSGDERELTSYFKSREFFTPLDFETTISFSPCPPIRPRNEHTAYTERLRVKLEEKEKQPWKIWDNTSKNNFCNRWSSLQRLQEGVKSSPHKFLNFSPLAEPLEAVQNLTFLNNYLKSLPVIFLRLLNLRGNVSYFILEKYMLLFILHCLFLPLTVTLHFLSICRLIYEICKMFFRLLQLLAYSKQTKYLVENY